VELASRGLTDQAIANELGYANRGTVHRIVSQALQAQQVATVEEQRSLEVARLDALQASLAPRLARGDFAATDAFGVGPDQTVTTGPRRVGSGAKSSRHGGARSD